MSNPLRKSNEGYRPKVKTGQMHRVTIDMWLPGDPGEISVMNNAAHAAQMLAKHGTMPSNTESITREVLDTGE